MVPPVPPLVLPPVEPPPAPAVDELPPLSLLHATVPRMAAHASAPACRRSEARGMKSPNRAHVELSCLRVIVIASHCELRGALTASRPIDGMCRSPRKQARNAEFESI
jgi:hypothetical protein